MNYSSIKPVANPQVNSVKPVANPQVNSIKPIVKPQAVASTADATKPLQHTEVQSVMTQNYILLDKLGKGSQGQVWRAERKSDGQIVAIKQLNVHSVTTWKQYELFRREADILASLKMDGIAPFYEYIEDLSANPPCVCIVQKFVEGQTLAGFLKKKHRFATETIYDIILQVLLILQKLHAHKPPVIHRDIKPSNLMLTPQNNGRYTVTLLDFGAVANPQVQNGGSTVAGTFGYMPPEQLMGQAVPASDIYALAAVAVELLSGVSPADIEVCDFKLVIEPYLSNVPIEVAQTLGRMLEPAVVNRFCDYNALIAQFLALANKRSPTFLDIFNQTSVPEISDVTSICQPGNYEIWQNFKFDKDGRKIHDLLRKLSLEMETSGSQAQGFLANLGLGISMVLIFIILTIPNIALTVFLMFNLRPLGDVWVNIGWVIQIVILIIIQKHLSLKQLKRKSGEFNALFIEHDQQKMAKAARSADLGFTGNSWTYVNNSQTKYLRELNINMIMTILKSGVKVIGKIVDIQYVNTNNMESICVQKDSNILVLTRENPKFKVTYQYRLPKGALIDKALLNMNTDDAKIYDYEFYGDMIVDTSPESYYKIGSMVPLMFYKMPYKNDLWIFKTIPFPYPFEAIRKTRDIVSQFVITKSMILAKNEQDMKNALQNYHSPYNPYNVEKYNPNQIVKEDFDKIYSLYEKWGFNDTFYILGKTLMLKNRNAEAMECFKKAADFGNAEASLFVAKHYKRLKSYKKAIPFYEKAFTGNNPELYFDIIEICKLANDTQGVRKWVENAAQFYRDTCQKENIYVYHMILECYLEFEDLNAVLFWGKKIYQAGDLSVAPDIADIYKRMKNFKMAIEWLQKSEYTKDVAIHIANIYTENLNDPKNALIWFKKSLDMMLPTDPDYSAMQACIERFKKIVAKMN